MSEEVRRRPFVFPVRMDDLLRGDLWEPAASEPAEVIVVCHGFKGFKDWGFFPYVAEELARRVRRRTVSFNFTGSGVGERLEEFTELEKFARNTFTREREDLGAVLDRLSAGSLGGVETEPARHFGLLGHSRGGATALLEAATRSRVRGLVTWSAIAGVERYEAEYAPRWEAGETVHIENARTGQRMPLERNILDDIRANRERLDLERAAASLRVPYLIVHGVEDASVPPAAAERLQRATGTIGELSLIEEAGHTYGAGHPFEGSNPQLEEAIERSAEHLRRTLAAPRV